MPNVKRGWWYSLLPYESKGGCQKHTGYGGKATILDNRFDGDELNVTLLLDQERWENFKNLEPHHNIMSATDPFEISDILKVQPQIVATTLNWMNIKQLERQQNAIKSNQESDGWYPPN